VETTVETRAAGEAATRGAVASGARGQAVEAGGGFAISVPAARSRLVRRRDSLFRRALGCADMLAVAAALVIPAALVGGGGLRPLALAVPPLFVVLCKAVGLYDRDASVIHKTTLDEVPTLFGIATLMSLLLFLTGDALVDGGFERTEVLFTWGLLFILLACLRSFARLVAGRIATPERCLFVGTPEQAESIRNKVALTPSVAAELVGVLPDPGLDDPDSLADAHTEIADVARAHAIDRVILTAAPGSAGDELLYIIRGLKERGVNVSVLPAVSRVAGSSIEFDRLQGVTLLGVRKFEITKSSQTIKRAMDLLGAGIGLILLAPFLAAVAVAIKLDSPGPIFFRQQRAGRRGEPFQMVKFRSMIEGADGQRDGLRHLNEGHGVFKINGDPRITRVGRWMRRMHLDELPQLFNVLRGEMSLVGPRPLPLEEDRAIEGWHRDRLEVRPGMTGHWQILGSARIPVEEMLKLDYLYVSNWSVWNDIKLLLWTCSVIARRRGM
jgi:exopolysaccharide biosynthesis polyprenyl glycosylphosphotransferase